MGNLHNSRIGLRQDGASTDSAGAAGEGVYQVLAEKVAQVRAAVEADVQRRAQAARDHNESVARQIEQIREQVLPECERCRQAFDEAAWEAEALHRQATMLNGLCGSIVPYDRENPDDQGPYRVRRMSLHEAIGSLGLTQIHVRVPWVLTVVGVLATIGMGLLLGLNLGVKAHWIEPELGANFEPDFLPGFLMALAIGMLLAVFIAWSVKGAAHIACSHINTHGWKPVTWATVIGAGVLTVGLMASDALLQMTSFHTLAEMTGLSGEGLPVWIFLVIGLIFALSYLGFQNYVGAIAGFNTTAETLGAAHADRVERAEEEKRRQDVRCQEASAKIAEARVGVQKLKEAERALKAVCDALESRIGEMNRNLRPIPTEPTELDRMKLAEAEMRLKAEEVLATAGGHEGSSPDFRYQRMVRCADELAVKIAQRQVQLL